MKGKEVIPTTVEAEANTGVAGMEDVKLQEKIRLTENAYNGSVIKNLEKACKEG